MSKLVILELEGDFQQAGFRVTLEIRSDAAETILKVRGFLPSAPDLDIQLHQLWHDYYRSLGSAQQRIKGQKIIYKGSINRRVAQCQEFAQHVRDRFRIWLNADSFQAIDRRLREEFHRQDRIRFLLCSDAIQVQKLPWHEWDFFEHYPNAELAFSSLEYERIGQPVTRAKANRVRILAILGNAQGLDLSPDRAQLKLLPNAEVEFLVEPDRKQINDHLWEQPWDIFFFAGHSETQNATGRIYINRTDSLSLSELKYGLQTAIAQGLQLAIFNSCDGLGLAYELQTLDLPQIIVMREPIADQVAHAFLHYFLDGFSRGLSLYQATRQARERLQGLEDRFPCASWLPVIYQNSISTPPTWQNLIVPASEPESAERPVDLQAVQPHNRVVPKPTPRDRRFATLKSISIIFGISAMTTLAVLGLRGLRLLKPMELAIFDQLLRVRPHEQRDDRLLVVTITKQDIDQLGNEYPIHDQTLLKVLQKLTAHQPRAIGIDIYRERATGSGWTALTQYLQQNRHIVSTCVHSDSAKPTHGIASPPNLQPRQVGFADAIIDADGVVRRHLLGMDPPPNSPCSAPYAFSIQLIRQYLATEGIELKFPSADEWQWGDTRWSVLQAWSGFYQAPELTRGHQILLNYRVYNSPQDIAKQVKLMDVLMNRVNHDLIQDKVILIGVTDPTVKDDFPTPYGIELRGLLFQAQLISQILSAVQDQRLLLRFWPFWIEASWIGFWAIAGGLIGYWPRSIGHRIITKAVLILIMAGISVVFMVVNGIVVPLVPAVIVATTTSSLLTIYRLHRSQSP